MKVISLLALSFFATIAAAKPLLICSGNQQAGSLVKSLELLEDASGATVKTEMFSGEKSTTKIISKDEAKISVSYYLDVTQFGQTSLVVNLPTKKAILLSQQFGGSPTDKVSVDFLSCK
ncbi:MAG: hypothetical protein JNL11_04970 [Bdellovibrionaceae bacterium]|nr:hypothetical protein [Pseudobdellovibrionaceae bacterium]